MIANLPCGKLAGILTLAAAFAASPARAAYENVFTSGHADINIGYDSGTRQLSLDHEFASNAVINGTAPGQAGAGERAASTITVFVNPANTTTTGAAGLPAPYAGNPLYVLPQTSVAGRPFIGFGAEEIDLGIFRGETLTLRLTGLARRPANGQMVLWQTGVNESNPNFITADGFGATDLLNVVTGGHDHYNFGFTQLGTYDLNFTASGTLLDGTAVSADATFRFQVGMASTGAVPEPASLAMVGVGLAPFIALRARRRRAGAARA